jgi:hypothetical protein
MTHQEGGLAAGESAPEGDLASGSTYVQAETWDGLDVIGFTKEQEWLADGSNPEADAYARYVLLLSRFTICGIQMITRHQFADH